MDQLLKSLGAGPGGMANLQGLFGGGNFGAPGDSQGDENEEILDDDVLMENAAISYDIYIQNSLKSTSHSV